MKNSQDQDLSQSKMLLHDCDIREPLFFFLESKFGKIRIIEEKNIGKSRADAYAVLPDKCIGIEIKSDADTYARLARQIKDYDRFFDANIIVVGNSHTQVSKHVPGWWGIIACELIENSISFTIVREFGANPKMRMKQKLGLLWRPELSRILSLNHMPKYERKSKAFVVEKISEAVDKRILNEQISEELFERDYTTIAQEIAAYRNREKRS